MRDILFRGKRKHNGLWVEGFYFNRTFEHEIHHLIKYETWDEGFVTNEIIPETIGQFTGLTDKNGKKIFEGDILRPFDDEIVVVSWIDCYSTLGLIVYSTVTVKRRGKEITENFNGIASLWDYDLAKNEVIGNIHDNPELWEV